MSKRFLIMVFTYCFVQFVQAQSVTLDYVRQENIKASQLNSEGKFREANQKLARLLDFLESQKAEERFFSITYQTKAKVVQNLGEYNASSGLARRSLEYALKKKDSFNIADNFNTIGINHYFLSDFDSTLYYYQRSFEIKKKIKTDKHSLAVSAYNLGILFEDLGREQKAMDLYMEAEEYLEGLDERRNFLPDVYVGIAQIHFYSGDIEKAEEYAEKAFDMAVKIYGAESPNTTFVYASYANILESEEKYKEAITLLEKSLEIRERSYGAYHRWTCETYYDLANVYLKDGEFDKAEPLFKKAIEIGERTNSIQYLANARTYLASMYVERGMNLDQAEELLEKALEQNKEVFGDRSEIVARNYYYLAKLCFVKKDEEGLLNYIGRSFNASNYDIKKIREVIAPLDVIHSLMLLSDWYEKQYELTKDLVHLQKAYGLMDQEINLIRHTQRNFSSDRSKINLASEYREVYEKGLNLCWKLYHQTKDQQFLEKAFHLSESNRNTVLLEGLQEIDHRNYTDIPDHLMQFEKKTRQELEKVKMDLYYEKGSVQPDKTYYGELLEKRIVLSNKLDSIRNFFLKNFPRYANLKDKEEIIGTRDVKNQLGKEDQIITYFLGKEYLYSFTITKDTVQFLRGGVSSRLMEDTEALKVQLIQRGEVSKVSKDLYLFLLYQQLDPERENVTIIADHVLNYIPFEILLDDSGSYVIQKHTVGYSGSTRLFLELRKDLYKNNEVKHWAGFAPSYDENRQLSAVKDEVELIAELLDGDSFTGAEASTVNFIQNSKGYQILHLAMHAEIDNNNPRNSKLIFSDDELSYSQIYLSDIKAELAVLSACNTGFGKLEQGEGVISMARAFHGSGIPSVLMSLWKVPDRETKDLMIYFYNYLKRGYSKSEALKKAKQQYLATTDDQDLRHPYYWAGFVLNGNTDELELGGNYWYVVAGGLLILALFFLWRKVRKPKYV